MFLWPCNVPAWQAWCALQTQWRTGMGGATGLDYVAVIQYLRAVARLRGDALAEAFEILQGAERAVLELWAEQRELSSGH